MRRRKKIRSTSGFSLIEVLVALLVGALLCFALVNQLGQTLRVSTDAMNEFYANEMAHSLLECLLQQGYTKLYPYQSVNASPTSIIVNGALPAYQPPLQDFPLGIDTGALQVSAQSNQLAFGSLSNNRATVTCAITPGNTATSILIIVTVHWFDSRNMVGRTTIASSVVNQFGIRDSLNEVLPP